MSPELPPEDDSLVVDEGVVEEMPSREDLVRRGNEHVAGWIRQRLDEAKQAKREFHRRWMRAKSLVRGKTLREVVPGTNYHIPAVERASLTLLKHLVEALFPSVHEWFDVVPDSSEDPETGMLNALAARGVLAQVLLEQNFVPRMVDEGLNPAILWSGTVVTKDGYVRRSKEVVRLEKTVELLADVAGQRMVTVEREEMKRVMEEDAAHPEARPINPFCFFTAHPEGLRCLDEEDFICETGTISHGKLHELRVHQVEERITDTLSRVREVGRYRFDPGEIDKPRMYVRTGVGEDVESPEKDTASDAERAKVFGHLWCEAWTRRGLEDILDGLPQDVKLAWLEWWGFDLSDMEPSERWLVFEVIDETKLVRAEKNSRCDGEQPYVLAQALIDDENLWGKSISDWCATMNVALDTVFSAWVDGVFDTVYPRYGVVKSAFDESGGTIREQLACGPNEAFYLKTGRTVQEAVQTFRPPDAVIMGGQIARKDLWELIRDVSGATTELDGIGGNKEQTALEVSTVAAGALGFVLLMAKRIEMNLVEPVLNRMLKMIAAYSREPRSVTVRLPSGESKTMVVQPEMLQGKMRVRAKGSLELSHRIQKLSLVLQGFSTFAPTGRLNVDWWIEMFGQIAQLPGGPSKLLAPMPQQVGLSPDGSQLTMGQPGGAMVAGGMQPPQSAESQSQAMPEVING